MATAVEAERPPTVRDVLARLADDSRTRDTLRLWARAILIASDDAQEAFSRLVDANLSKDARLCSEAYATNLATLATAGIDTEMAGPLSILCAAALRGNVRPHPTQESKPRLHVVGGPLDPYGPMEDDDDEEVGGGDDERVLGAG